MPDHFIDDTIVMLERVPRVASALLAGLPANWLDTADVPEDGWKPKDVIGHLVTGELTNWMPRAERILTDGTSVAFDRFDRTAMLERDEDVPLDDLLAQFADLRAKSIDWLRERVTDADLERKGFHPSLGEVTLRELLATWAVHDLDHLAQAFAGLAGSRDAEVGPWKAYLGLLLRREDPAAIAG